MGEETKKEETKVEAKQEEEKKEEKKEEKAEDKKEEVKPSPPPPTVLSVELHCVGCAKKIERIILRCKGAEDVQVDMVSNQVTIKGVVDAQELCSRIQKKTFRQAVLISPLPPPPPPADAESKPEVAEEPKESGIATVELLVNMHCEACAEQLKKKILKMKGVQAVETNLTAAKVAVTGTMSDEKLVEYIHKRTGKIAKVIPPPPPPPPPKQEEPEKKPEEEKPAEEKKDDNAEKKEEEKPAEQKENAETNKENGGSEEPKKEVLISDASYNIYHDDPDMMMRRMMYWNGGMMNDHEMVKKMVPSPWMPAAPMMPMYMIDRPSHYVIEQPSPMLYGRPPFVIGQPAPAPQFFSDENPNACCIS